ncbi:hypothetical protein HUU05_16965, partial [candidate division KSB1 bacterium]|nr:hypothetical protein [candidate division KSB1 bacterium]
MVIETVQNSLWNMVKGIVGIGQQPDSPPSRKIKLTTVDAYSLPQTVRAIRVISGGAWVSYKCEDSIVRPGETMT